MNFLCIDTTTSRLAVGLFANGRKHFVESHGAKQHNSKLLPSIEEVLYTAGLDISEIDAFLCVNGPGSFTGIRIGTAATNAFAQGLGKAVYEINALDIVASFATACKNNSYCDKTNNKSKIKASGSGENKNPILEKENNGNKILALIDAGHENFYGAEYLGDYKKRISLRCYTREEAENFEGEVVLQEEAYDGNALFEVAMHTIEKTKPCELIIPVYLRKSQAERMAEGE